MTLCMFELLLTKEMSIPFSVQTRAIVRLYTSSMTVADAFSHSHAPLPHVVHHMTRGLFHI